MTITPTPGHVNPLLSIARHLHDQGNTIIVNTADVFRAQVEAEGLRFVPLKGLANFDYRIFNKFLLEGQTLAPGPEEMTHNIKHVFGDAMLPQCDGIRAIMSRERVDLILTDFLFFGVFPLLLGPRKRRPPIISVSVSPIVLSSFDASPFGPATTTEERRRCLEANVQLQDDLEPAHDYLNNLLYAAGCRPLPGFFLDCIYTMPDLLLQLSVDALEFPRSDMPDHIKFVGPVLPRASSKPRLPEWWREIDQSKPVVLVTQGTVANSDLSELIGPTLEGLSSEEVTVVAATGRPDGAFTDPVPANARVVSFVPFVEILPRVDAFVTNGGFGAVNQALSMGVPLVIAGDTEDKAFVAARVAWTGAGISLGTSRPSQEQVRRAVREVLRNPRYYAKAHQLKDHFAQYEALNSITGYVELFLDRDRSDKSAGCLNRQQRGIDHGSHPLRHTRTM
jgi:MGT family glycosyltransferase